MKSTCLLQGIKGAHFREEPFKHKPAKFNWCQLTVSEVLTLMVYSLQAGENGDIPDLGDFLIKKGNLLEV